MNAYPSAYILYCDKGKISRKNNNHMKTIVSTGFTVSFHENVYEVTFQDMKSSTIDQYFAYLETIFDTTPSDQTICILLHSSQLPSFQNIKMRDQALRAKYARVPFMRLAVIYQDKGHLYFVNLMLRVINMNK